MMIEIATTDVIKLILLLYLPTASPVWLAFFLQIGGLIHTIGFRLDIPFMV